MRRAGGQNGSARAGRDVSAKISRPRAQLGKGGESRDVTLERGLVRWLDAQTHSGENIGTTPTHVLFAELKEPTERERAGRLGPS